MHFSYHKHTFYCARPLPQDENARKEENKWEFYMVGTVQESPDQRLLAWSEDTVGGEKYTLHVKVGGD